MRNKIDSPEGYEGKAAEKSKIVFDPLHDPQGGFTLKRLLKVTDLSKSTDMFHRKLILAGEEPETEPERLIKAEFAENKGRYGVRRITASLREKGYPVNHKVVKRIMKKLGLRQSMSRKGNCHDNAVMENFFGRLKVGMFYGEEKTFRNYEDFRKALEEYMLWYNQERIKEYRKWKSTIQALSTSDTL